MKVIEQAQVGSAQFAGVTGIGNGRLGGDAEGDELYFVFQHGRQLLFQQRHLNVIIRQRGAERAQMHRHLLHVQLTCRALKLQIVEDGAPLRAVGLAHRRGVHPAHPKRLQTAPRGELLGGAPQVGVDLLGEFVEAAFVVVIMMLGGTLTRDDARRNAHFLLVVLQAVAELAQTAGEVAEFAAEGFRRIGGGLEPARKFALYVGERRSLYDERAIAQVDVEDNRAIAHKAADLLGDAHRQIAFDDALEGAPAHRGVVAALGDPVEDSVADFQQGGAALQPLAVHQPVDLQPRNFEQMFPLQRLKDDLLVDAVEKFGRQIAHQGFLEHARVVPRRTLQHTYLPFRFRST